jgi:hypothetical protein
MNHPDKYIFIKLLLLAFFVLMLNSWLTYHVGENFIETYFANGVLFVFAIVSFFMKYLKKGEDDNINQIYSSWLAGLLNFQVILGLFVLFFTLGCFVSSIHISSYKIQTGTTLDLFTNNNSVTPAAKFEISENNPVGKQTVLAIPFGRTFILKAKGYQPLKFQVYPWIGKRITLENDLQISPTVIVRVPVEYFMQLPRAKLNVKINDKQVKTYDLDNHATLILGQIPEIPEEYFDKWYAELRGSYEESVTIYKSLNKWSMDEPLFIPADFLVYDSLKLELTSAAGKEFAVCKGMVDANKFKELKFKSIQR